MTIKTGHPLPHLELPLVGGGRRVLADMQGRSHHVLVFYRGLHCRRCNPYLNDYQSLLPDFAALDAGVLAVSSDDEARARESVARWGVERLAVAWGFPIERAGDWGFYVTEGQKPEDPPVFTEPALFVLGPDGKLDQGVINVNTRFRPDPREVLELIRDRREAAAAA